MRHRQGNSGVSSAAAANVGISWLAWWGNRAAAKRLSSLDCMIATTTAAALIDLDALGCDAACAPGLLK